MDGLQKQFAENHTDPAVGALDTMDASGNVAYRVSGYDTDTVKSCIKGSRRTRMLYPCRRSKI